MAGLGFFLGGLSDQFQKGQEQASTQNFRLQELQLQQQAQQNQQKRFETARIDKMLDDSFQQIAGAAQQLIETGVPPEKVAGKFSGPMKMMSDAWEKSGRPRSMLDSMWASVMAAPPKTQVIQAEAAAKVSPIEMAKPVPMGGGDLGEKVYGTYNPQTRKYEPVQLPGEQTQPAPTAPTGSFQDRFSAVGGTAEPPSADSIMTIKSPYTDSQLRAVKAAQFTPQTIDFEAIKYAMGGPLPSARSKAGQLAANLVKSRGDQWMIENGISPGGANAISASRKAAETSLSKLTLQKNQIEAFESSELKNLDVLVKMASKVDTTGMPAIERWIRAGRVATGDPDVAAFNTQMSLVQAGAAKIITNPNLAGVLTDQQVREIQAGFPSASNLAQIKSITNLLKGDFARRSQAIDEQVVSIKKSFSDLGVTPAGGGQGPGQATAEKPPSDMSNEEMMRLIKERGLDQ